THAFYQNVQRDLTGRDLGTLGGPNSEAHDINQAGQIVGRADIRPGRYRAFLLSNGQMLNLGTLGGSDSAANAVNDRGTVVGYSKLPIAGADWRHAFLYRDGVMHDIDTIGRMRSEARDVNNRNQVVGF